MLSVLVLLCIVVCGVEGQTITHVSTCTAAQTIITTGLSGSIVRLSDGSYSNCILTIAANNITVTANNTGRVYFTGTAAITISGNYNVFSGFQFIRTNATLRTKSIVEVQGIGNTVTRCNFDAIGWTRHHIRLTGQYHTISYNNFQGLNGGEFVASGPMSSVVQVDPTIIPGNHQIRYNSFQNFNGAGGDNGNEPIRLGQGATSNLTLLCLVEFNVFNNTQLGDSETVSVKSWNNVIRYNTVVNNSKAEITFRNGDYNVAYGNYVFNSGGFRAKQANNIYIYNNYIEGQSNFGPFRAEFTSTDTTPLYNINFLHNTLVNTSSINLCNSGPCTNTSATLNIYNNIFVSSTNTAFFLKQTDFKGTITFSGNIYDFNSTTLGLTNSTGLNNTNPNLTRNAVGVMGLTRSIGGSFSANIVSLSAISSITTAAWNNDNQILLDLSAKSRPTTITSKDPGCDQYQANTWGTINARPLTVADVGPYAIISSTSVSTVVSPLTLAPETQSVIISGSSTTAPVSLLLVVYVAALATV